MTLKHLKKILRSRLMLQNTVAYFLPKLDPNCPFARKRYFGKFGCYYCIPSVFSHATTSQKNNQRANHKAEGCIILAQTGCDLLPKKFFFGKVDQNCFSLSTVSHHAMSFQINRHRVDQENKVANFLSLVQKGKFFGKLTNITNA